MAKAEGLDVIHRLPDNPILTLRDVPFQCSDIHNAAVLRHNEDFWFLITVESLEGQYALYLGRSQDGRRIQVDEQPFMRQARDETFADYESLGVRDPRITALDGTYYITYVAEGDHGHRIGLARTNDFNTIERLGFLNQPDTKNGILFPEKVKGRYALLERPDESQSIWISYSDDLVYWGGATVVMTPRGGYWDADRIGAGPPPVLTEAGWLLIYYGVKETAGGPLFRLGAAILDREDPARVISRCNIPILSPRESYERIGDLPNLVFSCGALVEKDETLSLYYAGSDSCLCLGTAPIDAIVRTCCEKSEVF